MKIAVTAKGKSTEDQVDPRFGRCAYFLVVDLETMNTEAFNNPNASLGGGAGIQSAQMLADLGVKVLLTGNCGPNAFQTMSAADIEVIVGSSGKVREVIEDFKSGSLSSTTQANVSDHFGVGGGAPASSGSGGQFSGGQQGTGRRMGGGLGSGRGMGMGRGSGRGMGMGRGMSNQNYTAGENRSGTAEPEPGERKSGLDDLKSKAEEMKKHLRSINENISRLESGDSSARVIAVVNSRKCSMCGDCVPVCPQGAITMETSAVITPDKCIGCGICVSSCPPGAITLEEIE